MIPNSSTFNNNNYNKPISNKNRVKMISYTTIRVVILMVLFAVPISIACCYDRKRKSYERIVLVMLAFCTLAAPIMTAFFALQEMNENGYGREYAYVATAVFVLGLLY